MDDLRVPPFQETSFETSRDRKPLLDRWPPKCFKPSHRRPFAIIKRQPLLRVEIAVTTVFDPHLWPMEADGSCLSRCSCSCSCLYVLMFQSHFLTLGTEGQEKHHTELQETSIPWGWKGWFPKYCPIRIIQDPIDLNTCLNNSQNLERGVFLGIVTHPNPY